EAVRAVVLGRDRHLHLDRDLLAGPYDQRLAHGLPVASLPSGAEHEIRTDEVAVDRVRVARTHAADDRVRPEAFLIRHIELGIFAGNEISGGGRISRPEDTAIVPVGADENEGVAAFAEEAVP